MTDRKWPFPGDSPVVRARKVALAYRTVALEAASDLQVLAAALSKVDLSLVDEEAVQVLIKRRPNDPVAELDERFLQWGEKWHAEQPARDLQPDDEVTSKEAGALLNVAPQTVNRMRIRGRIKGRWVKGQFGSPGHWKFKVSDVYALSSELRGRGWRAKDATVTVPDNGSSDP